MPFFLALLTLSGALSADPRPSLGLYQGYGAPAEILRGIVMTESSGYWWAVGDDGISLGAAQLNSCFHAERAQWWGAYSPYSLVDSLRITSCLYLANLRALLSRERMIDPSAWEIRREDLAIASHRQGLRGVLENGMGYWYVQRVRSAGNPASSTPLLWALSH